MSAATKKLNLVNEIPSVCFHLNEHANASATFQSDASNFALIQFDDSL